MKHIKKKYAVYIKDLPIKENASLTYVDRRNKEALKNIDKKEKIIFLKDTSNHYALATLYNNQEKEVNLTIPIPDLTLVYYDSAYMSNFQRKSFESDLFEKLSQTTEITDDVSHEIYRYVNYAATSIIMMFTSMESFLNNNIPEDGIIFNDGKILKKRKKNKDFDKNCIQRYVSFEDKILKVIPFFKKRNYFINKDDFNKSTIGKLKTLRDEIIHTKSSFLYQKQSSLFNQMLDFEFDKTLLEVKGFMNFYKKDYVENCPCDEPF